MTDQFNSSSPPVSVDDVQRLTTHALLRERAARRRTIVLTTLPLFIGAVWLIVSFRELRHTQERLHAQATALVVKERLLDARTDELNNSIHNARLISNAPPDAVRCPPTAIEQQQASAVTLAFASRHQLAAADTLMPYFERVSATPVRTVVKSPGQFVPYATEVRYYRYPDDLKLAQAILLELQNTYGLPLSRVSYVQDPGALPRSIQVHFNTSPLRQP